METWSYNYLRYVTDKLYEEMRYERRRATSAEMQNMLDYEKKLSIEFERRRKLGITDPPGWCDGDDDSDWECECPRHSSKKRAKK